MSEFNYSCHGIRFSSAFACPELEEATESASPDVCIIEGETPDRLPEAMRTSARFQVAPDQLLLQVDNVARFWVRNGNEIIVQRDPKASANDVRVFLYGTAFGAVILQQGRVPLHATTVEKDGRALAIAGASNAGKSTLAHTLMSRGWNLVCDDISALEPREDGLFVQPGFPSIKLWRDVLEASQTDISELTPIRSGIEKFRWEVGERFRAEPARLRGMIGLFPHNESDLEIRALEGAETFVFIGRHTYRRQMIEGAIARRRIFSTWSKALLQLRFWSMRRPYFPMDPKPLADAVESLFE